MLFIRRTERSTFRLTHLKDGIKRSFAPKAGIVLVVTLLLFMVMSGTLFPLFLELRSLQDEKRVLTEVASYAPEGRQTVISPNVEGLPTVIDQCVRIFQNEDMKIRSFNLERFGEGEGSQPSHFNFALVRFNLEGTWEGVQSGLKKIESLPGEAIHAQEAQLRSGGGEILLKIYFQEPDNPPKP